MTADPFACLYVIEIDDDRVKVGYTANPSTRLRQHRGIAEAHGCKPGRQWVSSNGTGTDAREQALIAYCAERATGRFRSEYFVGVPFADAVQRAADLCGMDVAVIPPLPAATLTTVTRAELTARVSTGAALPRLACRLEEAADWLALSEDVIQQQISTGVLRTLRYGRLLRIPVIDLFALTA